MKAPKVVTEENNPYIGDRRQLVVLASFADRTFKGDEAATMEQWEKIFNAENFNEQSFYGSIHDYFFAQSYGLLNLTFDLQYVELDKMHTVYGSTQWDDENSQYLVDDIVDVLQTRNIDWSPYDWNGDGEIEQLLIVYAGKGSAYGGFGGDKNAIWPHQWWLNEHLDLTTSDPNDYRDALTVESGDQQFTVNCYCALQELNAYDTYGSFGTICHEYSHCFGLPDFYESTAIIKDWDLMDYGNYSGQGFHPCGYSAHERFLMGWLQPVELTAPTTITDMPALHDEPVAYLVRNEGCANEYYIIENRQRQSWDAMLPGSGIVIFHIDYDPDLWLSKVTPVNTYRKKRYYIFPANNNFSIYYSMGWAYPYGSNDMLTDTSSPSAVLNNPNTDGTLLMSKPITNMAVTGGLASFDFCADNLSAITDTPVDNRQQLLYQLGPVSIVRDAMGKVKKVVKK
jgi:M6 family metalloprotease-like protein